MKQIFYMLVFLLAMSCSPGDRENKDLTNEKDLNVSPNQTQSEEEQAKKDSTSVDLTEKDTASE